ncbi:hypothetical protein SAY87_014935 [Trapa incisa]|uniref:BHLH domain-containing protein n=1 Tax=Trapa incisa TaxID=236973 RepID=A0AAN7H0G0_9MYRT|nr:hypothetical protein SAY87_014935 [Trapa incisa]
MEACDGGEMGFQQERNAGTNCKSNPISHDASAMTPMMMPKPSNVHQDRFFNSGWDPLSAMVQSHHNVGCPPNVSHKDFANFHLPPTLWENQGIIPHLANYPPPNPGFLEMAPRALGLMSCGLPDIVGPMRLFPYGSVANSGPDYALNVEGGNNEGAQDRGVDAMNSPSAERRRRKRTPDSSSPYELNKSNGDAHRDPSGDTHDIQRNHHEKKQKIEQFDNTISRGNQTKEDSNSGEPPKENYIHIRARRGQATNSHSLAERVRREKISERMRMLQELVPGCNKITGKAVMLDEIINYVQSLQQQVEFLSMKLATLLPNLSTDLERVLSKEVRR